MARAFSRVVEVRALTNFAIPFEDEDTYPQWELLTAEGIAVLDRPFTEGFDTGPDGFLQSPGYNYIRDNVALDLVAPTTAIFDTAFSPITL